MLLPSGRETEKGAFPMCILEMFYLKRREWIVGLAEQRETINLLYKKGHVRAVFNIIVCQQERVLMIMRKRP